MFRTTSVPQAGDDYTIFIVVEMLSKRLAPESLASELKFSPAVLRGLGALQSWSLKISSADLSGVNGIGAAQGVWWDAGWVSTAAFTYTFYINTELSI